MYTVLTGLCVAGQREGAPRWLQGYSGGSEEDGEASRASSRDDVKGYCRGPSVRVTDPMESRYIRPGRTCIARSVFDVDCIISVFHTLRGGRFSQ